MAPSPLLPTDPTRRVFKEILQHNQQGAEKCPLCRPGFESAVGEQWDGAGGRAAVEGWESYVSSNVISWQGWIARADGQVVKYAYHPPEFWGAEK